MPVTAITLKADYAQKVTNSQKIVVVDFYADWCGPCKKIAPHMEALSNEPAYKDVCFYKVDIDALSEVSEEEGIKAMPTIKIYKNGVILKTIIGADIVSIQEAIRDVVSSS